MFPAVLEVSEQGQKIRDRIRADAHQVLALLDEIEALPVGERGTGRCDFAGAVSGRAIEAQNNLDKATGRLGRAARGYGIE